MPPRLIRRIAADDDAYTIWTINSYGSLTYVSPTGINVDYHSYLAFTPDNLHAYGVGCYFASWDLFGFTRNNDGTLASFNPQAQIPPGNNNPMYCPADLAVSAMNYVVVAYQDVSNPGSPYLLAVYTLNSDGTLGLVQNSEVTTPFTGEESMAFDPHRKLSGRGGQRGNPDVCLAVGRHAGAGRLRRRQQCDLQCREVGQQRSPIRDQRLGNVCLHRDCGSADPCARIALAGKRCG